MFRQKSNLALQALSKLAPTSFDPIFCHGSFLQGPTAAAVPDVVSLLEQINTAWGSWNAAMALVNGFFSSLFQDQKQLLFIGDRREYVFTGLPQSYTNSPTIGHNISMGP